MKSISWSRSLHFFFPRESLRRAQRASLHHWLPPIIFALGRRLKWWEPGQCLGFWIISSVLLCQGLYSEPLWPFITADTHTHTFAHARTHTRTHAGRKEILYFRFGLICWNCSFSTYKVSGNISRTTKGQRRMRRPGRGKDLCRHVQCASHSATLIEQLE